MSFDYSLPKEWHWSTLNEAKADGRSIVSGPFGSNIGKRFFVESGVPVIRGNNLSLGMGRFKDEGFVYLTEEKASEFRNCEAHPGDLLFTAAGTIGQVGIIPPNGRYPKYIISNKQLRARLDSQKVEPLFAYYWFASPVMVTAIQNRNTGSTIPLINLSVIKSLPIPLPPLHEQRQIVAYLSLIDDRITLLRETNATLEAIAQALFRSWFVDFDPVRAKMDGRIPEGRDEATAALFPDGFEESELGLVPRGWRVESVYAAATVNYGAPFASKQFNSDGFGAPLIRIRDLRDEAPGVFTPEMHPKGYMVQPGDIVVGMDGEFRAYLWGGEQAWLNQRVCVFAPKAGWPAAFVHRAIMPLLAAVEASETATTVIHLGKNDVDRFRILIPNDRVIAAFANLTDGLYSKIVNNKQNTRTLATLRDTLLPRLISGQLRLPQIEDQTMEAIA